MKQFRTGKHWGVTIVLIETNETPDQDGRRLSDKLVAVAFTPTDAQVIVDALNGVTDEPASRT